MVRSKQELELFNLTGWLPPNTWIRSTLFKGQTGIVLGQRYPTNRPIDFSKVCWERSRPEEWLLLVTDFGFQTAPDLVHWEPMRSGRPSPKNPAWITPGLKLVDVQDDEEIELEIAEIRGPWALLYSTDPVDSRDIHYPYYGIYKVKELTERFTFRLNRFERVALLPTGPL